MQIRQIFIIHISRRITENSRAITDIRKKPLNEKLKKIMFELWGVYKKNSPTFMPNLKRNVLPQIVANVQNGRNKRPEVNWQWGNFPTNLCFSSDEKRKSQTMQDPRHPMWFKWMFLTFLYLWQGTHLKIRTLGKQEKGTLSPLFLTVAFQNL